MRFVVKARVAMVLCGFRKSATHDNLWHGISKLPTTWFWAVNPPAGIPWTDIGYEEHKPSEGGKMYHKHYLGSLSVQLCYIEIFGWQAHICDVSPLRKMQSTETTGRVLRRGAYPVLYNI